MTMTGALPAAAQIVEAVAAGEISRAEAMDLLRMSGYSQLLNALADPRNAVRGRPSPPERVEAELAGAMPVLCTMEARHAGGAGENGDKAGPRLPSGRLRAFARGLLSHRKAVRAGRLRDYAELLAALGKAGLAPPRPPECEIEAEAALLLCIRGKRATLLIAEEAPLESLRAAGRLDLLLRLGARVLVPDGVLDALARDPGNPGRAAIRAFVAAHSPPIAVEKTWAGDMARRRRLAGLPPKANAGDIALADFLTAGGGIDRYLRSGDPFLVLCERLRSVRLFGAPPQLHMLSTAGLLRGLERAGVIASADEVLRDMLRPPPPALANPRRRFPR